MIDARSGEPAISGAVKMSGVDIAGLIALAGQSAPVTGSAGMDVKFCDQGRDQRGARREPPGRRLGHARQRPRHRPRHRRHGRRRQGGQHARGHRHHDELRLARLRRCGGRQRHLARHPLRRLPPMSTAAPLLVGRGDAGEAFNAKSDRVTFGFDGAASLDGLGAGKISLSTGSLRDLLAWIGQPIDAGRGLKAFSISGDVKLAADSFSFENAAFTLDKSSGVGTGKLSLRRQADTDRRPQHEGARRLALSRHAEGRRREMAAAGRRGWWWRRRRWRRRPAADAAVDFSGLRAMDASLNLKAEKILANAIKIGPSALTVKIANGRLDANLTEMALYSGAGTRRDRHRRRRQDARHRRKLPPRRRRCARLPHRRHGLQAHRGHRQLRLRPQGERQDPVRPHPLALRQGQHGRQERRDPRHQHPEDAAVDLGPERCSAGSPRTKRPRSARSGATFTIDKGIVTNRT